MATAAEEEGTFCARSNFKASIEETIAVLQHCSIDSGGPGGSEHAIGASSTAVATAKTASDGGEERPRSMSDIIAEAMRENGLPQQPQSDIVRNDNDRPRKSTSTAAAAAVATALTSPPSPSPPSRLTSAVARRMASPEAPYGETEDPQALRDALSAASAVAHASPAPAGKPSPAADGIVLNDSDQATSTAIPKASPCCETGVARAMAEAILDEGYMAPSISKHLGAASPTAAATAPAGASEAAAVTASESDSLNTKVPAGVAMRPVGREPNVEASRNSHEASSTTVPDAPSCSRDTTRSKILETKLGGTTPPVTNRGGIDAPFGHAVIIEEHVRAELKTSPRNQVGRRLGLHVGLNKTHTPAGVNLWRKSGGEAKAPNSGSAGAGYSSGITGGSCDDAQGTLKAGHAAATAGAPPAAAAAAKTMAKERGHVARGGDGFLTLQGGRSSLNTLASLAAKAGIVARPSMPSRGGSGAPGRDPSKRSSPDNSTPEEYVLLQQEREAGEAVLSMRGDSASIEGELVVSVAAGRDGGQISQAAAEPGPIRGGDRLFHLRGSLLVEQSSVAVPPAVEEDEEKGGDARDTETGSPDPAFVDAANSVHTGGGDKVVDGDVASSGGGGGAWSAAPSRHGIGQSGAGGGWDHVDGNGCLEDVDDDKEEKKVNDDEDPAVFSSDTPRVSVDVGSPLNELREAGENQGLVAPGRGTEPEPEPRAGKLDQSELLVVEDIDETEPLDHVQGMRSFGVNGAPARCLLGTKADVGDNPRGKDAGADSGPTAGKGVCDAPPCDASASAISGPEASADNGSDGISDGNKGGSREVEDSVQLEQQASKKPAEKGGANKGALVYHDGVGLPEPPLAETVSPGHPESASAVNSATGGAFVGEGGAREGVAVDGGGGASAGVSFGNVGRISDKRGYESSGEEDQPVFSTVGVATQQQVVDGLPSSCSARNTGSGGTLVISMAEAVGARAAAPEELLGHFVRAGGGDVDKAAALYRDVADEFVELREIARNRQNASSPAGGVLAHSTTPVDVAVLAPVANPAGFGESEPSSMADGATTENEGGVTGTKRGGASCAMVGSSDAAMASSCSSFPQRRVGKEVAAAVAEPWRPPQQALDADFPSFEADPKDIDEGRDEYSVTISSQKLGMTVENVLERTVVRAAAPGGGAEAAGVETGSLLVALDGQSTKDSSHFEVIELLRVAKRPLTLRLRRVARERLVSRRAEMRALTRSHGVIATGGAVGGAMTADQVTAALAGSSLTENRDSSPGISASIPLPSPALRELSRKDSAPLGHPRQVSDTHDAEAARIQRADGGKGGTRAAVVGMSSGAVTAAAAPVVIAPGGLTGSGTCSVVVSRTTRDQAAPASVAGFSTGNWEAVEWAESRLLKILRLLCVGEEVRASEEEEAAAAAAAQAAAEARAQAEAEAAAASAANPRREIAARDNAVAVSTAGKLGQGKNVEERTVSVASSGGRHPSPRDGLVAGPEEAWGNGQSVLSGGAAVPISTGTNVGNMCGKDEDWEGLGVWRATEAEEAEASRAHSEYIRREETHKAIVQLLLEFSDMLERDWRQDRRQDHSQGGKNADVTGNPIGGGGSGAGGGSGVVAAAAAAACTARGRIESMGALVEQLGPLIDWESEAVVAVEPELRELLFVLLDADLNFDLSSAKFPHLVGGGVAAMMQELLMHLPTEQAVLEAPPLAHRLALSNSVCARGACCAMVATTYSLPSLPGQLQFRGILSRLLHDRINGVRGEAVKALAYVAPVADASTCRWLMLLVERASRDEDLSVRRASVDTLLQIGRRLLGVLDDHGGVRGPEDVDGYAIGGMNGRANGHTNGHTDGHPVQDAVEGEEDKVAKGTVADADADVEVEAAACDLRREIHALRSKLLPTLSRLAADTEWQVRVEIACRLDILCVALGEDCSAVTTEILPSLVKDTDHDVRSEAIRCLPRVARILLGFAMSGYAATVATVATGTGTDSSSVAEADPRPAAHQEADDPAPALVTAMSPSDTCSSGCDGGGAPSSKCWLDTSTGPSCLLPSWEGEGGADGACAEASAGREDGERGRDAAPVSSASCPVSAFHRQEPVRESIRERVGESIQEPVREAVSQEPSSVLPSEPDIEFEERSQAGPLSAEVGCSGSGGFQGFPADDDDIGDGDDGDGDRSLGGIGAAAQRARRDILGALMPAVAMLIEDSTAEVRATAAISLGEVLRLMVGFEDCVAALGSSGSGGGQGVGVGGKGSGDVRNTLNGRGRRSATGSMETCCCVTGEDSEGLVESSGAGRRVCHGKLLREAEAAAVSAADAMAEAAMTAELMDLAGFEPNRDEDEDADLSGNSDAISGEGVGVGDTSEGFPVDMEEDVDAHMSALLQADDPSALVGEETLIGPRSSTENSEGFSHPSEGDARAVVIMGARKAGSPGRTAGDGHETNNDERDGATSACALAVEKLCSTTRHGEPKCPEAISAASPGGTERDDEGYETSQEDNWGAPVDEGKGTRDDGREGGRDIDASPEDATAGGGDDSVTVVVDPDLDGDDPLIALVRRLLLDADANVAWTMLQALRPAWGAELGPGPGPERRPLRAAVGDDSGEEWQPPGKPEGRGYPNGRDEALSPVRSCMLTPAQVGCVLPALAELFRNPLWRLRAAVAEALPALVSCTLCDRLKEEVIKLGRRMLFDRVDAVRRSAAEQLVMAARIDLDRCPARHLHHVPGACTRETRLPSLRPRQPSPEPNPTSAAHSVTEPVQQGVDAADAGPGQGEEDLASDPNATMPPQGVKEGDESTFEYRVDARTCVGASPQTEDDPPRAPEGSGEVGEGAEVCPRDRGGACGMWLRLVMAPLMRECLEASYRGKLLALHMTQAAFRVGVTTPAVMTSVVVPSLLRGLSDPVPNVRLTAARVADDVLAVAAMSSWPAPDGRSRATALTHDDHDGDDSCGDRTAEKGGAAAAAFPWAFTPAENDSGTDVRATAVFEAASAPLGSGSGSRADGAEGLSSAGRGLRHDREPGHGRGNGAKGSWWDCGWQEVELQLEALSGGDPDRDVAYFAAQALKPKWEGDVWRP